jgi:hypothetical protein
MRHRQAVLILAVLLGVALGQVYAGTSPGPTPMEFQVKAAFLHKFIPFVAWPDDVPDAGTGAFKIGVLGDSPLEDALKAISEKDLNGHGFSVEHFDRPEAIEFCHILFIVPSEEFSISHALKLVRGKSILTASDTEGFLEQGGIICFFIEENKVRFAINVDEADKENIRISSKLLRLARIHRDGGEQARK